METHLYDKTIGNESMFPFKNKKSQKSASILVIVFGLLLLFSGITVFNAGPASLLVNILGIILVGLGFVYYVEVVV